LGVGSGMGARWVCVAPAVAGGGPRRRRALRQAAASCCEALAPAPEPLAPAAIKRPHPPAPCNRLQPPPPPSRPLHRPLPQLRAHRVDEVGRRLVVLAVDHLRRLRRLRGRKGFGRGWGRGAAGGRGGGGGGCRLRSGAPPAAGRARAKRRPAAVSAPAPRSACAAPPHAGCGRAQRDTAPVCARPHPLRAAARAPPARARRTSAGAVVATMVLVWGRSGAPRGPRAGGTRWGAPGRGEVARAGGTEGGPFRRPRARAAAYNAARGSRCAIPGCGRRRAAAGRRGGCAGAGCTWHGALWRCGAWLQGTDAMRRVRCTPRRNVTGAPARSREFSDGPAPRPPPRAPLRLRAKVRPANLSAWLIGRSRPRRLAGGERGWGRASPAPGGREIEVGVRGLQLARRGRRGRCGASGVGR
jgi:hypothetical protein